ncbi:53f6920d-047c-4ba5-84b6-23f3a89bef79 [Thermothielavioides terrestris]|uniref:53f6920d-047c-4ba5-84b6-23f3a89bef79 n=1 Tax=Thermothielavioides terrestris TaxID=2587410 RepID=A0A3S4BBU5_9PEZI|nr:53f6920d-047c-4ba5-84b6-23f3a89bef79 [Thermothielavioides terrestris]
MTHPTSSSAVRSSSSSSALAKQPTPLARACAANTTFIHRRLLNPNPAPAPAAVLSSAMRTASCVVHTRPSEGVFSAGGTPME